jgi:acyl-CoA thioesterase
MQPAKNHVWPPYYYMRDGAHFIPSGLARSPWDRNAIAGGPLSALLARGAEDASLDHDFGISRFTVDIFGKAPHQPLTLRTEVLRDGRQTKLHRILLCADGQAVAQAHVLRVRRLQTPHAPAPHDYPAPETCEERTWLVGATMAGAIRTRPVRGSVREPGRGVGWLALDGEIVAGETPSGFVKAALFADFGNGVGSATRAEEWSYANLDITLQFLRMPVGEWILIDAETHMEGNGHGVASSTFADRDGVYARGAQTIFVAPGRRSPS